MNNLKSTLSQLKREPARWVWMLVAVVVIGLSIPVANIPLLGSHPWRQADTLFTGYFFCHEDPNILRPRVAQRGETSGIAIGEFPLYSYVISIPCQVTGVWSEALPKFFSIFIFLISSLILGLALARRFRAHVTTLEMAVLLVGSEVALTFLTRTLPDVMGVFCFAIAGYFWTRSRHPRFLSLWNFLGTAFAVLGFLIRPYLIPLSALFIPPISLRMIFLILMVKSAYQWWFVEWVKTSTFTYYHVNPKSLAEAITEFPAALLPLFKQVAKDHLNYIMIPFFLIGLIKRPYWFMIWLGSVGLVLGVSGKHFATHSYYMLGPALIAVPIVGFGLPTGRKMRTAVLALFAIIGLANTQHYFHAPRDDDWSRTEALVDSVAPYKTKIVTLSSMGEHVPIWLYYAKRTGWSLWDNPENRERACKLGGTAVLIREANELSISRCESF